VHPGYTGKILTVLPNGNASSIHYHKLKHETFYIMRGCLALEVFVLKGRGLSPEHPIRINMATGTVVTLPAFTPHRFWAEKEVAEFIEISTPDDPADSYRLVKSGPVPK
jgi:D-lyxose ketol-isomerase